MKFVNNEPFVKIIVITVTKKQCRSLPGVLGNKGTKEHEAV